MDRKKFGGGTNATKRHILLLRSVVSKYPQFRSKTHKLKKMKFASNSTRRKIVSFDRVEARYMYKKPFKLHKLARDMP